VVLHVAVRRGSGERRKLAALASLFEHLCDANAVTHNPVKGVKCPKVESYEGKTPALGNGQAWALLDAPGAETEKGKLQRELAPGLAEQEAHGIAKRGEG
jgi:integrase/recombinase XerD